MADGIRIQDAAIEISPSGLEAMLRKEGTEIKVTRLDLSVSPEALNTLLQGLAPAGQAAPKASLEQGRVRVDVEKDGKPLALDLQIGGVKLEITAEGLRLVTG
jgi:hypothetical protein